MAEPKSRLQRVSGRSHRKGSTPKGDAPSAASLDPNALSLVPGRQVGRSRTRLCAAKSSKSRWLAVASGRSHARQQAAIHESATGRGRPRRRASAVMRPHVRQVAGVDSSTRTSLSQSPRRRRRGAPQSRKWAQRCNSPAVMNDTATIVPCSAVRRVSKVSRRRMADATSGR